MDFWSFASVTPCISNSFEITSFPNSILDRNLGAQRLFCVTANVYGVGNTKATG
jgi:hypothetical protein